MARDKLGDIPDARFNGGSLAYASVASDGAAALLGGPFGPFAHNIRVRNAWAIPTGADQGANTASYRRLTLVNGGTAGTGTAVIGSVNFSASVASKTPAALTVDTTVTIPSGAIIWGSQATVGGNDATGTVLRAGNIAFQYEVI